MPKRILAITTCRVSSIEQMENNSLERQGREVIKAAETLGATIPADGQWSGSVSSKAGTNTKRKDLQEMLDYCRKNKSVKYLIVHEVDRFMRSIKELFYFEVEFEKLGVKVWYASQPELNTENYQSKFLKALEAFKGEGSNEERIRKSIDGCADAVRQGRYPCAPKPGYKRGYERGIQEPHPIRGPILRDILVRVASHLVTASQGLVELNKSQFVDGHAEIKMDKFRKWLTDPFYAGILDVDKQVKVYNENGLHEPLITKEQHHELVRIMNAKPKTQVGPRKNGNPKYPCSNLLTCERCVGKKDCRYAGLDLNNGKNKTRIYEKYRCRSCGQYMSRSEVHRQVEQQFKDNPITKEGSQECLSALNIVWNENEGQAEQEAVRVQHKIQSLKSSIEQQVEAATDPANVSIKGDILSSIVKKKEEILNLEDELEKLKTEADSDWEEFLRYAYDFAENTGRRFFETSRENRLLCKQLYFPVGFYVNAENKIYTPEVSSLIRLASKDKNQLVRVRRL